MDTCYIDRVAYAGRWALESHARGADGLFDQVERQIYLSHTGPDTLSTLLIGQNDNSQANSHPLTYRAALMGAALWLTTQHKLFGKGSASSNGWRVDSRFSHAIQTDTAGATATSRIYGSVVYVVARSLLHGSARFTVVIDGREYGPYATESSFVTMHGLSFAPFAVRIAGLNAASHRVTVVNRGGGTLHLDFMAGNSHQLGRTRPFLVMATDYQAKTFSRRALINLNAMVRTVEAELAEDGLGVSLADVQSACDDPAQSAAAKPAGSYCSLHDGVHPDDSGERRIANAFLAALPVTPVVAREEMEN